MSTNEQKQVPKKASEKSEAKPRRNAEGRNGTGAQRGKGGNPKVPQIPNYLKLSPKYLGWKRVAKSLSEKLKEVDMSISELGKAIADYSSRGATFEIEKSLVSDYDKFETARLEWEKFRDSFRNEMDAAGLPTGLAAKLLGTGSVLAPAPNGAGPSE